MAIGGPAWQIYSNVTVTETSVTNDNAGTDTCSANATAYGDAIAYSFNGFTGRDDDDWEFRVTLSGRNPSGRAWVGIASTDVVYSSLIEDPTNWRYCLHVSTETQTNVQPPHPANSVYIFEGSTTPKTWADGIWLSNGQVIRILNLGGVVCYYVDSLLIYRSLVPLQYPLEAVVMLGCHGMSAINTEIVTGPGVGIGTGAIDEGPDSGGGCLGPWQFPSPGTFPLPPVAGAPIPVRFQETTPEWNEYGQQFADQSGRYNSRTAGAVRTFEVDWDGLDPAQVALLDAHYESTASGVSFVMTHPHTQELITGCRYLSYTRGPHVRYWSQSRQARIIKYPV